MSGSAPLVSVIIPAYNVSRYIGETIASVLAQRYSAWEIRLVNDGSTDTPELERVLQPFRTRLHYTAQPNRGAGAARNTAIRVARGSLLAFLDGDDTWHPEFLDSQVALLETGGYDLVYADARLAGEGLGEGGGRTFMEAAPSRGTADLTALLDHRCHVLTSTSVVRRQPVLDAGLFDETIRRGQDFDLWVRLALNGGRIGYQRKVLGAHRQREDSLSGNAVAQLDRALELYRILLAKEILPPAAVRLVHSKQARLEATRALEEGKLALRAGDYIRAADRFRSAWRRHPSPRLLGARAALAVAPGLLREFLRRRG